MVNVDPTELYANNVSANDLGNQCGGWTISWQGQSGTPTIGTTLLAGIEQAVGVGDNPKTSVLNKWNQSHDIKNLFVVDGASFVTCGWQNPTMTILSLSMRASEYLAGENAAVALLPTTDVYRAIAAVGTAGPDCEVSNEDLIAWLRDLEKEQPFFQAIARVRQSRLRTGATQWGLFRDGEKEHRFVELFVVPSWEEHLRQHRERLTGADRQFEEQADALSDPPPQTEHLIAADADVH